MLPGQSRLAICKDFVTPSLVAQLFDYVRLETEHSDHATWIRIGGGLHRLPPDPHNSQRIFETHDASKAKR